MHRLKFLLWSIPVVLSALFLAFWATILLVPLWRWVEADFGIEAIGHSGPAEWCFTLVFAILLAPALTLLWRACRAAPPPGD